jgi:hypothetical protein
MAKRRSRDRATAEDRDRLENDEVENDETFEDDKARLRARTVAAGGLVERTMAIGEGLTVGIVSLAVNTLKAVVYGVVDVAATAIEGVQEIGAQLVGAGGPESRPRHTEAVARSRGRRRREAEAADTAEVREAA